MKNASPLLLVVLGLLVGVPAARLAIPAGESAKPAAKVAPAKPAPATSKPGGPVARDRSALQSETCKPAPGAPVAGGGADAAWPWCMPVRLLRQFFGLPAGVEMPRGQSLQEIVERARETQYDLRFLVALVPALPDPRMDQALDGIQRGFAHSMSHRAGGFPPAPDYFLLDRVWLPWTSAEAGDGGSPAAPGLLLFRGVDPQALEAVFVVPETSKMGIQKEAFREALDLIADLQGAAIEPRVAILGPSFSGSVESLRLALLNWRHDRGEALAFRAATGSASAEDLEPVFQDLQVPFCRAILPDSVLQARTFDFLSREMGWDLRRVGLLVEDDTQYGQSFVRSRQDDAQPAAGTRADPIRKPVLFTFPSHLADLRNAWEDIEKRQKTADANPVQPVRRTLGLDLSGEEREADLVPTFSSSTTAGNDLLVANLLETIAREGIRYVGIVATDPKDKLFLAEKLRQLAPDVVLFTYDNNLLYAHPDQTEEMSGMLVLSSYPLFTEGAPGFPGLGRGGGRSRRGSQRRQFASEYQEGVFQATRHLLGGPSPPPQAWIAAVGNGSLWPVARLPVDAQSLGKARFCGQPKKDGAKRAATARLGDGFDAKDDLQALLVAGLFCLLAVVLSRAALLEEIPGAPVDPDDGRPVHDARGNRVLLGVGLALLAVGAGVLLAVAAMPLWSEGRIALETLARRRSQWIYLLILAAAYGWLVARLARVAWRGPMGLPVRLLWALGGVAAFAVLVGAVFGLGVPGDQAQLFYLRARAFSSGLSPLVPLAIVGGALYVWLLSELQRRRLLVRLASDCPLEAVADPALAGTTALLRSLRALLTRTFPRRTAPETVPPWVLPALVFPPAALLLGSTVQPIAEPRACGRLFVLFVLAAYSLSALSFYRFVFLWRTALRLLHRLDNAAPAVGEAFQGIAKELDWRPIQSFGWQIPPFRSLTLSARKLRELAAAGKVDLAAADPERPDAFDQALSGAFAHERSDGSVAEIANRIALERIFARACADLHGRLDDPQVRQFLALRVAAYLRFVFAHLRSCLVGALACGLLALLGVAVYAFEPKHLVTLAGWLGLALEVALTLWIFLQMDRNPTLSRIGDTTPGQVTLDRAFLTKLVTYAGVPVLGLVATQFPAVGQLLGRVVGQVLRIVGGG